MSITITDAYAYARKAVSAFKSARATLDEANETLAFDAETDEEKEACARAIERDVCRALCARRPA